jgi:methionyl aminopeptidase
MIVSKSKTELEIMREAGRLVALTHEVIRQAIRPGVTTRELDRIGEAFIRSHHALPSFKGYHGFPASICASVNEEVVHGIPGDRVLQEGDIVSIDIGVYYKGYHGDAAVTYPVGEISETAAKLLRVTEESLYKGIEKATVNNRLYDISHAVQQHVEAAGFSVVRDFVGHGIGQNMHEEPQIPNFGPPGRGPRLKAGMVLAIEPMVNAGQYHVQTLADNWTVVTVDGSLSAHFEHTVAVTENGPEILTLP